MVGFHLFQVRPADCLSSGQEPMDCLEFSQNLLLVKYCPMLYFKWDSLLVDAVTLIPAHFLKILKLESVSGSSGGLMKKICFWITPSEFQIIGWCQNFVFLEQFFSLTTLNYAQRLPSILCSGDHALPGITGKTLFLTRFQMLQLQLLLLCGLHLLCLNFSLVSHGCSLYHPCMRVKLNDLSPFYILLWHLGIIWPIIPEHLFFGSSNHLLLIHQHL